MAIHLVGLPWTELTKEWEAEAFTARTRVLASTLARFGKVYVYGGERHETVGTEYVQVIDRKWQQRHFPGFRTTDVFSDYDPRRPAWLEFNVLAAMAIRQRAHPGDMLGITMGVSQGMLVDLLSDLRLTAVEVGVGYKGVLDQHRVYESWQWRTFHHGRAVGMAEAQGDAGADLKGDVRNFDEVIPRGYEVEDFPAGSGSGGYYAFLGRCVARKGLAVAGQAAQRAGVKLVVAGHNVTHAERGKVVSSDGTVLTGDVEYVGMVNPSERAALLGGAIATFVPTLYLEPFGGVHAESLLVGTPVITTPHGCFIDYVHQGVNGYRCSTMAEFVDAVHAAPRLSRERIRATAIATYSTDVVGPQYDRYLNRLRTLGREGWYEEPLRRVA